MNIKKLATLVFLVSGLVMASPVAAQPCADFDKDEEIRKLEEGVQEAVDALYDARVANALGDTAAATEAKIKSATGNRKAQRAWLRLVNCGELTESEEKAANLMAQAASDASAHVGRIGDATRQGNRLFDLILLIIVIGGFVIVIVILRRR